MNSSNCLERQLPMVVDMAVANGNKSLLGCREEELAARAFLILPDEALTLVCLVGNLWLTRERDFKDHLVYAGQQFTIRCGDRIVVQALRHSRVRLIAA